MGRTPSEIASSIARASGLSLIGFSHRPNADSNDKSLTLNIAIHDETAEEALSRMMDTPRGYAATNAGRFNAFAFDHLWRALNPYYAALQGMVKSGVMSSQSMNAMIEAQKFRQEWEANNRP